MSNESHLFLAGEQFVVTHNCHSLGKGADWLLPVLTDRVFLSPSGSERVADIAVILATTHSSKLADALLSRCLLKPKLTGYTADESIQIVEQLCSRMDVDIWDLETLTRIAEASNNNPRTMRAILTTCRDMLTLGKELDLDFVLKMLGITQDGLESHAQNVLFALLGTPGYTASQATIGSITGDKDNLERAETELIARGLITVTGRGRVLTKSGKWRAKELLSEVS